MPYYREDAMTPERLAAGEAIRDRIYLICTALDRAQPERLADAFHSDATIVVGNYSGGIPGFIDVIRARRDSIVRAVHMIGNVAIRLPAPDRAFVESYCQAVEEVYSSAGDGTTENRIVRLRYADAFVRRDGDWRILRRIVIVDHAMPASPAANASLFRGPQGRRDAEDPALRLEAALAADNWMEEVFS
jgi:hypothetical protein